MQRFLVSFNSLLHFEKRLLFVQIDSCKIHGKSSRIVSVINLLYLSLFCCGGLKQKANKKKDKAKKRKKIIIKKEKKDNPHTRSCEMDDSYGEI